MTHSILFGEVLIIGQHEVKTECDEECRPNMMLIRGEALLLSSVNLSSERVVIKCLVRITFQWQSKNIIEV